MKRSKRLRTQVARARKRIQRAAAPPKPRKLFKIRAPRVPVLKAMAAIMDSFGNKSLIAKRLGVTQATVLHFLQRSGPGWDKVQELYREELEEIKDVAEETIADIMRQRVDLGSARQAAQWYLDRKAKDRGYGKETTVVHEGGDKAIQVEQRSLVVHVDTLNLPLEVKRQILQALEQKETLSQLPAPTQQENET